MHQYLTPMLLIVIALIQQYRSHLADLSPWKGGGFGMFSTVDTVSARYAEVWIESEGQKYPVRIPDALSAQYTKTRTYPTQQNLKQLGDKLLGFDWYLISQKDSKTVDPKIASQMKYEKISNSRPAVIGTRKSPAQFLKKLSPQRMTVNLYRVLHSHQNELSKTLIFSDVRVRK